MLRHHISARRSTFWQRYQAITQISHSGSEGRACGACGAQVADLQVALKEEQIIVEEKKGATQALIESIGREKAVVDEAVEVGREDEEAAAKLQARALLWL